MTNKTKSRISSQSSTAVPPPLRVGEAWYLSSGRQLRLRAHHVPATHNPPQSGADGFLLQPLARSLAGIPTLFLACGVPQTASVAHQMSPLFLLPTSPVHTTHNLRAHPCSQPFGSRPRAATPVGTKSSTRPVNESYVFCLARSGPFSLVLLAPFSLWPRIWIASAQFSSLLVRRESVGYHCLQPELLFQ